MLFSKKKKKIEEPKETKVQDTVAKGIAGFLLSVQNKFTSFMSERVNNLSSCSKQFCLGIFCLLFGGFSIYAFLGAFHHSENSVKTIKPDQVAVPKYYDQRNSEFEEPQVSAKDITRINHFREYMDSLSRSSRGRSEYDSILKARPGLMDSIKIIEEIYYSQSK